MELVRISEHLCMDFPPLFWIEESIPKVCKSMSVIMSKRGAINIFNEPERRIER